MTRRRDDSHQLLIEWPTPPSRPAVSNIQPPASKSPLIQRLKWDFQTTFPQPTDEAIDAGVIDPSDTKPENLKSLHENYSRSCLATLAALDKVMDARRRGVDPGTGAKPRSHAAKERLRKYLNEEPGRLEHAFRILIETYGNAFGTEPAEAFEKAIRAWHAGVRVFDENTEILDDDEEPQKVEQPAKPRPKRIVATLPVPKPLPQAIAEARFGQTGSGPVRPGPDEVREITETHAEKIIEQLEADSRANIEPALAMYAEDFGDAAAKRLDAYCRKRAGVAARDR